MTMLFMKTDAMKYLPCVMVIGYWRRTRGIGYFYTRSKPRLLPTRSYTKYHVSISALNVLKALGFSPVCAISLREMNEGDFNLRILS